MTNGEIRGEVKKFTDKTIWWLRLLTVVTVICAIGFGLQLQTAGDRANEAKTLAQENRRLFSLIQAERKRNVLFNCLDINSRRDDTIRRFDKLIARLPENRRIRANERRASTIFIIDGIVPRRDCYKYAARQVRVRASGSTRAP